MTDQSEQRPAKAAATRGLDGLGGVQPAVILVNTQIGDNIGSAARSMLNFGLTDLRLVAPRCPWPNDRATVLASGADVVLERARVFETVADAVADLDFLVASTARPRDMVKPVATPAAAAARMRGHAEAGGRIGILFGPERTGLENEDIALADLILTVPLNPAFASLNLAQAVALFSYEWFTTRDETVPVQMEMGRYGRASKKEVASFFDHLAQALDWSGVIRNPEMRPTMLRNVQAMFQRADLTGQEVRSMRGFLHGLMIRGAREGELADFPSYRRRRAALDRADAAAAAAAAGIVPPKAPGRARGPDRRQAAADAAAGRITIGGHDALLVVDLQYDFMPGGALAVADGDAVVPLVNRLGRLFAEVVLTQDWHPAGHTSFASSHAGHAPFQTMDLDYGAQVLWPDHCVQGSRGADLHDGLDLPQARLVIRKGDDPAVDSYSAFLAADRTSPTGLEGYLRSRRITRVFICGLATDFCVAWTALDARAAGFEAVVVEDACRAIDNDGSLDRARQQMQAAGVRLVGSTELTAAAPG
ncbi:bifunctional nicotinamidase/pyrazinamidase [Tistrella sp. BH-R2-4]|uniref:tRNA (cytidine/uridine-2'-O-)-methyltransferase TrmJ n=1 Tax=Tistrella arctica TaxID=3133430 RepID=A0ABU9YDJ2_9PROT